MKNQRFLLVLAVLIGSSAVAAQTNRLYVLDPQFSWQQQQGTIEEAIFTLKPQGVYTEVGMYLTLSALNTTFAEGQQLEIVLDFNLPVEAIVNDSWLWVDKDIIRAKILDRWTASTIYENIVNRRKDPSVLYKNGQGRYQLRIYPLIKGKSRQVKINYLVPASWTETEVVTTLPASLLTVSKKAPDMQVRFWPSDTWKDPRVITHPDIPVRSINLPELGNTLVATIPGSYLISSRNIELGFSSPMKNGVFLTRYGTGEEGFYQLAVLPASILNLNQELPSRRLMVLIQYNPANTTGITKDQLLSTIRDQLAAALRPKDYFNVQVAGLNTTPLSPDWMPATAEQISNTFKTLQTTTISSANLPTLLAGGIRFVVEKQQGGSILLFGNSSLEGDPGVANSLISELSVLKGSAPVPCYFADYQNRNQTGFYVNGTYYYGNQYFYLNWSKLTKGDYLSWSCCGNLSDLSKRILELAFALNATLDFHTSLQNGFCYNRYTISGGTGGTDLQKPILQVGKYQGKWPFEIELAGNYDNQLFLNGIVLDAASTAAGDSATRAAWAGNHVRALETSPSTRDIVEIINTSLAERVLSLYTAFLCLEPAQGGEPCLNCADESKGEVTSTQNPLRDSIARVAFSPNPFRDRVLIQLTFAELVDLSAYRLSIFNNIGQEVRRFDEMPAGRIRDLELQWNGRGASGEALPGGLYFFAIQGAKGKASYPLLYAPGK